MKRLAAKPCGISYTISRSESFQQLWHTATRWLAPGMSFEDRIMKLCALAVTCQTEEEAVAIARELRILLHEQIESLRGDANGLSALESASESTEMMIDRPPATLHG